MTQFNSAVTIMKSLLITIFLVGMSQSFLSAEEVGDHLYTLQSYAKVKIEVLDWVADLGQKPTPKQSLQLASIWQDEVGSQLSGEELLDKVIATFGIFNVEVANFVADCKMIDGPLIAPEIPAMEVNSSHEFFKSNLAAFAGRYFSYRRMYDEALQAYGQVELSFVVDPGNVLFNQAVCQHTLLKVEDALVSLHNLQHRTSNVSTRYLEIAKLMEYELTTMKEKSLDEVARQMLDVERRLDLGRSGHKTQKLEDQIITSMDQIIAQLEKQKSQGQGPGNSNQPGEPADDSQVKGSTAPGNVDKKNIGQKDGWGNLPPQEQAKAKQVVGNLFPPHYEKVIEKFSEKSATRKSP